MDVVVVLVFWFSGGFGIYALFFMFLLGLHNLASDEHGLTGVLLESWVEE